MGRAVEAPGEILHHGRNPAAPPTVGENKVAEQKTQGIANVQPGRCDPGPVGHPGRAGKCPGAEAGHETTQTGDQPGNTAASAEIFRRAAIETHDVKPDHHHQHGVDADDHVVHAVCAVHCRRHKRLTSYTVF